VTIDITYVPAGDDPERWDVTVTSIEGEGYDDVLTVNLTFASEPTELQIKALCQMFGLTDER
jgi:hypothetical protein